MSSLCWTPPTQSLLLLLPSLARRNAFYASSAALATSASAAAFPAVQHIAALSTRRAFCPAAWLLLLRRTLSIPVPHRGQMLQGQVTWEVGQEGSGRGSRAHTARHKGVLLRLRLRGKVLLQVHDHAAAPTHASAVVPLPSSYAGIVGSHPVWIRKERRPPALSLSRAWQALCAG